MKRYAGLYHWVIWGLVWVAGVIMGGVPSVWAGEYGGEKPDDWGSYTLVPGYVETNLFYSDKIFDRQNDVTDKVIFALRARQDGILKPNRLYLGGRFFGTMIAERTNTAGKFPILSRFPPTHTKGKSDLYFVTNEVAASATLNLPWVTAFMQGEYTEVPYRGQDDIQLRKYWVTIGDLNVAPFYLSVGRKTVNFGNFSTYAPFTHSHVNHYFWAQTRDPVIELGYVTDSTLVAVTLISNHRSFRVINSPDNNGNYENFALNFTQKWDFGGDMNLTLGGGFLRGTIYDSTLAHHPPVAGFDDRFWNGALNFNATLSAPDFDIMAEVTRTLKEWPATFHKVTAVVLQGRYRNDIFDFPVVYSLIASRGTQGATDTRWEQMSQIIASFEIELFGKHVKAGAEYMFNDGFVPLIMPLRTADDGVVSHTGILGIKLTF